MALLGRVRVSMAVGSRLMSGGIAIHVRGQMYRPPASSYGSPRGGFDGWNFISYINYVMKPDCECYGRGVGGGCPRSGVWDAPTS